MHQAPYAATVLERAGIGQANPVLTPAVPGRRYSKYDGPTDEAERARLASMDLTKDYYMTRDDMRYVQGKTAKFCANPGQKHFNALKHQLRFLKGTMSYGVECK